MYSPLLQQLAGALAALVVLVLAVLALRRFALGEGGWIRVLGSALRSAAHGVRHDPEVRALLARHPRTHAVLQRRIDTRSFRGLPLTLIGVAGVWLLALLGGLVEDVITSDPIVALDLRTSTLLAEFRTAPVTTLLLWVTLLGKSQVVVAVLLVATVLLEVWKRRRMAVGLWVTMLGSWITTGLGKLLFHRARPLVQFYTEDTFSFPSGHATASAALYGFLAYALWRLLGRRHHRATALATAVPLILAIGFSRIYLGVHFLSDVLAGFSVGLLWVLIGISVVETARPARVSTVTPPRRKTIAVVLLSALALFYVYMGLTYRPPVRVTNADPPVATASSGVGALFTDGRLPAYSESISGAKMEPLSVLVIAPDDAAFVALLEDAGWVLAEPLNMLSIGRMVRSAVTSTPYPTAPITPSFWNAQVHDFGFQKPGGSSLLDERHHARFWKTSLVTEHGFVYVGTASFDARVKWLLTHVIAPDIDTEREELVADLRATGRIGQLAFFPIVRPVLGRNFAGDPFFTDGKAYLLRLGLEPDAAAPVH